MHSEVSFSVNEKVVKSSLVKAYDKLPKMSQRDAVAKLPWLPCLVYSNNKKQSAASDGDKTNAHGKSTCG